ncbi:hypothetical protein GQS52_03130 [Streptomyces sp. SCUT-3]|uniref:hypothetical protein n=1 Tax=Streptomyces sp. SCUT-3 TaxID=2684469 RepID=UPI0015FBBB3F|nr:hypothetical protein [Streptomyces sp. SCUT-3]QMV20947.1 hypothetical protein GQS52_03130 [Streptomyces sp. SCUT-3]
MFFFLSNRTGCLGSLLIGPVGTAVLFLLLVRLPRPPSDRRRVTAAGDPGHSSRR